MMSYGLTGDPGMAWVLLLSKHTTGLLSFSHPISHTKEHCTKDNNGKGKSN